jgi:hypothetical protein
MQRVQTERSEVEHHKNKSHGGRDRGDTFPTCGAHRRLRHEVMGPRAFTRMMREQHGMDLGKLCKKLATVYEAERWPCP